jgi:hypothetical protein
VPDWSTVPLPISAVQVSVDRQKPCARSAAVQQLSSCSSSCGFWCRRSGSSAVEQTSGSGRPRVCNPVHEHVHHNCACIRIRHRAEAGLVAPNLGTHRLPSRVSLGQGHPNLLDARRGGSDHYPHRKPCLQFSKLRGSLTAFGKTAASWHRDPGHGAAPGQSHPGLPSVCETPRLALSGCIDGRAWELSMPGARRDPTIQQAAWPRHRCRSGTVTRCGEASPSRPEQSRCR